MIGDAALAAGAGLGLEFVDEVDDVEEAATGATADQGAGDGDGKMALAGAGRTGVMLPGVRRLKRGSPIHSTRAPARLSSWSVSNGTGAPTTWSSGSPIGP